MVLIQRMGVTLTPKCLRTLQEPSAAMIRSLRWSTGAGWSWPSISGRGGTEEVGERRRQKGGFNRGWKAGVDEEDGLRAGGAEGAEAKGDGVTEEERGGK